MLLFAAYIISLSLGDSVPASRGEDDNSLISNDGSDKTQPVKCPQQVRHKERDRHQKQVILQQPRDNIARGMVC